MLRVIGVLFALALYIYFIIDVVRTPRGTTRNLPKWLWLIIVVLVPIIGGLLWWGLGRTRRDGGGWWRKRGPVAPDDDPRFLRKLDEDVWSSKMRRRRGKA